MSKNNVDVQINDYELVKNSDEVVSYYTFKIEITTITPNNEVKKEVINRRFNDFKVLNKSLINNYKGCKIPLFPPDNLSSKIITKKEVLDERKEILREYLFKILNHEKLGNQSNTYLKVFMNQCLNQKSEFSQSIKQKGMSLYNTVSSYFVTKEYSQIYNKDDYLFIINLYNSVFDIIENGLKKNLALIEKRRVLLIKIKEISIPYKNKSQDNKSSLNTDNSDYYYFNYNNFESTNKNILDRNIEIIDKNANNYDDYINKFKLLMKKFNVSELQYLNLYYCIINVF